MQSEQIDKLAKALAAAQKDIGGASKSSTNPHFKSKYADLAEVWSTWQEVGPKNGLALIQTTQVRESGAPVLVTVITHESGQWMRGEYPLNPVKNDPQGLGACMTYARRYSLAAMVGIAPEDDDGETASGRGQGQGAAPPAKQTKSEQVNQQTGNGVDTWITNAKATISQMPDRHALVAWQKSNEKTLASMKERYQEKHADFVAWLDDQFTSLPAAKDVAE